MKKVSRTFINILNFSSDNFRCKDGRTDDTLNLTKKYDEEKISLNLSFSIIEVQHMLYSCIVNMFHNT